MNGLDEFQTQVLNDLGEIKAGVAATSTRVDDHHRRLNEMDDDNRRRDTRHWITTAVIGPITVGLHLLARKAGLDI